MGQFINKKKIKMNKLICILLCILLISLSVVSVFATNYSYTDTSAFCNAVNSVITCTNADNNRFFVPNFSTTTFSNLYNEAVSYWNLDVNKIKVIAQTSNNTSTRSIIILCSDYDVSFSYKSADNALNCTFELPSYTTYTHYGSTYNSVVGTSSTYSLTSYTNASYRWGFIPYSLTFSPVQQFTDLYILNSTAPDPENGGGGNGNINVGDIGDVDWTNFAAMWAGFLFNNYKFTANNTTYNSDWDSIGFDLTYLARCAMNPTLATITIDNTSYPNYFNKLYVELSGINTNTSVSAIALSSILSELDLNANGNNFAKDIHAFLYDIDYQNLRTAAAVEALANVYASTEEVTARQKAAENQAEVVNEFIDSNGDGSVSASNLGELADSSAEIKSNFDTGYSASGVWDVFDRNWDWFSNTTKNNLEPPAQNVRSVEDYETPFLDNAINEILRLRGN